MHNDTAKIAPHLRPSVSRAHPAYNMLDGVRHLFAMVRLSLGRAVHEEYWGRLWRRIPCLIFLLLTSNTLRLSERPVEQEIAKIMASVH